MLEKNLLMLALKPEEWTKGKDIPASEIQKWPSVTASKKT
jgi:hypothetical protein